jgi:hypothetical protein
MDEIRHINDTVLGTTTVVTLSTLFNAFTKRPHENLLPAARAGTVYSHVTKRSQLHIGALLLQPILLNECLELHLVSVGVEQETVRWIPVTTCTT